jgi:hypothetical protein
VRTATFGIAVLVLALHGARAQVVQSREALLAGAESARARIVDLTLHVTTRAERDDKPGYFGARQHESVILKGGRIYRDYEFGTDAGGAPVRHRNETAFNGAISTFHHPTVKRATISRGEPSYVRANGSTYLVLAMLLDPEPGQYWGSLIGFLRSPRARVRPALEDLDDARCQVVDLFGETGALEATAWIDAERGFLVRKSVLFYNDGVKALENHTIAATEVLPGLWLPIAGERREFPHSNPGNPNVLTITVDLDSAGTPRLAANTGVPDSTFDLYDHLPEGTRAVFAESGLGYLVPVRGGALQGPQADLGAQLTQTPAAQEASRPPARSAESRVPPDAAGPAAPATAPSPAHCESGLIWWLALATMAAALIAIRYARKR